MDCTWRENEESWYVAECENDDEDFWLDWHFVRNFDYCPYCGKKIQIVRDE